MQWEISDLRRSPRAETTVWLGGVCTSLDAQILGLTHPWPARKDRKQGRRRSLMAGLPKSENPLRMCFREDFWEDACLSQSCLLLEHNKENAPPIIPNHKPIFMCLEPELIYCWGARKLKSKIYCGLDWRIYKSTLAKHSLDLKKK